MGFDSSSPGKKILNAYFASLNIERAVDASARVTLVFEKRYRVHFVEATDGRVLIESRIIDLPEKGVRRDSVLMEVGKLAWVSASRHEACCAVDENDYAVWLQMLCAPDDKTKEFARKVDVFVDLLAFWRKHLERIHF